jgi:glucosamine-phosphate N-acetyltransferase
MSSLIFFQNSQQNLPEGYLFNLQRYQTTMSSLIFFQNSQQNLPDGYRIRKLEIEDYYNKGYKELLLQLMETYDIENFERVIMNDRYYHIVVIENVGMKKIVATGTVFIEQKFIYNCGKVAHIENVVVDKDVRHMKFASIVVRHLLSVAKFFSVYKCVLSCDSKLVSFYNSLGFTRETDQMCYRTNLNDRNADLV